MNDRFLSVWCQCRRPYPNVEKSRLPEILSGWIILLLSLQINGTSWQRHNTDLWRNNRTGFVIIFDSKFLKFLFQIFPSSPFANQMKWFGRCTEDRKNWWVLSIYSVKIFPLFIGLTNICSILFRQFLLVCEDVRSRRHFACKFFSSYKNSLLLQFARFNEQIHLFFSLQSYRFHRLLILKSKLEPSVPSWLAKVWPRWYSHRRSDLWANGCSHTPQVIQHAKANSIVSFSYSHLFKFKDSVTKRLIALNVDATRRALMSPGYPDPTSIPPIYNNYTLTAPVGQTISFAFDGTSEIFTTSAALSV